MMLSNSHQNSMAATQCNGVAETAASAPAAVVAALQDLDIHRPLQGQHCLPVLHDPASYKASTFDWTDPRSPVSLARWVTVFQHSIPTFARHVETTAQSPDAAREFVQRFGRCCDAVLAHPGRWEVCAGTSVDQDEPQRLCALREHCLASMGLPDIFHTVKVQENRAATALLPAVVQQLDALTSTPREQWAAVLQGVFAGNLFDLGAAASSAMYANGEASFHSTLEKLKPRPWVVDDLDAALDVLVGPTGPTMGPTGPSMGLTGLANSVNEQSKTRIQANTTINTTNNTTNTTNTTNNSNLLLKYQRKVVLLVDNAGSDVVLGMLPLARQLLASRPQCTVVLGANELPSINDVTACELRAVVEGASAQLGAQDVLSLAWKSGRLQVVSTGNGLPVIDLTRVSQELADAAVDAELLVLEGMGRSIETNLYARTCRGCDVLKLGMVKHPEVADMLGGTLLDCVCKFDCSV